MSDNKALDSDDMKSQLRVYACIKRGMVKVVMCKKIEYGLRFGEKGNQSLHTSE